jgi:site-specific DNA-methyltransferase (adenine-specific)
MVEHFGSRFYNVDATTGARQFLADESVDLIITDPPYGIEGDKLHRHYNRDERFVVDGYIEVPKQFYNTFSRSWIAQAARVLKPGGSIYIVSGYTNLYDILDALRATDLAEVNHLIWKYNFGVFTRRKYVSSHYHILYYVKPGGRPTFNLQSRFAMDESLDGAGSANYRDREDVWIINREYKPGQEKNKNELPTALLAKMLQYSSSEGDTVCDFFMGGCSTAAAAIGMNRRFVGFELSEVTFASRVPRIKEVIPGSLLPALRTPATEHRIENAGKPWSPEAVDKVLARYCELAAKGEPKRAIVDALCGEFKRGSWAIRKLLKSQNHRLSPQIPPLEPSPRKMAAHRQSALAAQSR